MKALLLAVMASVPGLAAAAAVSQAPVTWKHLSSATGDLPAPNRGTEQTSITIGDFGRDGHPGFVLTEREFLGMD